MCELYTSFNNLQNKSSEEDLTINVIDILPDYPHKLGKTQEGYPVVFVKCSDKLIVNNIEMNLFKVIFNSICTITDDKGNKITQAYTIFQLNSVEKDLQEYFIKVIQILLKRISKYPKVKDLNIEINKIIKLFDEKHTLSKEVIKGLWTELFVIANASNIEYLINAWHVNPDDIYDFNDGIDKIEVKSTSNLDRIHCFSLEQLNPNVDSNLVVVSIIVLATGLGQNIFDLIDSIKQKVTDLNIILKLEQVVYQTLGPNIEDAKNIKYDYTMANDTYAVYDYKDIPSINKEIIPTEVVSVNFKTRLKTTTSVNKNSIKSKLINSL